MNTLKWILVTLMVLFASATQAQSTLITFDDLNCGGEGLEIPDGYMGYDWDNFYCLNALEYGESGYFNGMTSAENVAYNAYAEPASLLISSLSPGQQFSLQSANLTGAWNNDLDIRVEGFLFGAPVYDEVFTVDYDAPTLVEFNPAAVDMVRFSSSGGVETGDRGSGSHFAMDDLTVNAVEPVPVPTLGFWGLLALILASGAMAWQRLRTHA